MDWSSERWVKLYTRKTPSWNVLPWQSRALLPLLLKECDRSGQIELGRAGVAGLAACVGLPIEVAAPGLAGLIEDGSVTVGNAVLTVEKYVEAQESATSNAERQRRFKDRQKHLKSPDMQVTGGNGRKRAVTCLSVVTTNLHVRGTENMSSCSRPNGEEDLDFGVGDLR